MNRKILSLFFLGSLVLLVFYFSWLPNPDIGFLPVFPAWLGRWINVNGNFRTAAPFVLLGGAAEILFVGYRTRFRKRALVLLSLLGVVLIAELGQLYLPRRTFDWLDVMWAMVGAIGGMLVVQVSKKLSPKKIAP